MAQAVRTHYDVLEISLDASVEEIKRAFRRLARIHHPDQGGDEELFKLINAAHHVLSDPGQRAHYDRTINPTRSPEDDLVWDFFTGGRSTGHRAHHTTTPPPPRDEWIDIMGVRCRIVTNVDSWSYTSRELYVPITGLEIILGGNDQLYDYARVIVIDADGNKLFHGYSISDLRRSYHDHLERQRQLERVRVFQDKLAGFREELSRLRTNGLPVDTLDSLVRQMRDLITAASSRWARQFPLAQLQQITSTIENELKRLAGDPLYLFVHGLMNGEIEHLDMRPNSIVLRQLESLSIRSGGFIEAFDATKLERFYRSQLAGVTTLAGVYACDLRIRLQDYAPREIVDELELAPETILLHGNKGEVSYGAQYGFVRIDGRQVACGIVELPYSVFTRNAGGYKQGGGFPTLPHNIALFVRITLDGKPFLEGLYGDELIRKADKKYKARSHKNHADPMSWGAGIYGYEAPTDPPPWFKGRPPKQ